MGMQDIKFQETTGKTIKVIAPMGSGCVLFSKLLNHICENVNIKSGYHETDEWFGRNNPTMMDEENLFVYILRDPIDSITESVKVLMNFKDDYATRFQDPYHLLQSINIAKPKWHDMFMKSKEKEQENSFKITYESMFINSDKMIKQFVKFFDLTLNENYFSSITAKDVYSKMEKTGYSFWIPDNQISKYTMVDDAVRNDEEIKEMQKQYLEYKKEIDLYDYKF
jgi:energy-coupling factor transporter ATP-binding protein EcfA2